MTLQEQAGLIPAGLNEDGEMEWIGTDEAWRKFVELETQFVDLQHDPETEYMIIRNAHEKKEVIEANPF